MNVLYTCRAGQNDELRYSLRSLANLDDGTHDVFVVGDKPDWLVNVTYLPGNRCGSLQRRANATGNLLRACSHIPESVVVMDDDMYVMEHGYQPRVQAWGTVAERVAPWPSANLYAQQCRKTLKFLTNERDIASPRWFDLHTPFPCNREQMLEALSLAYRGCKEMVMQYRMIYGNFFCADAEEVERDVKVYPRDTDLDFTSWPLLSTDDASFRFIVRSCLECKFPTPSVYEGDR